jgi:hypothetical protein
MKKTFHSSCVEMNVHFSVSWAIGLLLLLMLAYLDSQPFQLAEGHSI